MSIKRERLFTLDGGGPKQSAHKVAGLPLEDGIFSSVPSCLTRLRSTDYITYNSLLVVNSLLPFSIKANAYPICKYCIHVGIGAPSLFPRPW